MSEWRAVEGHVGYRVSDQGEVQSCWQWGGQVSKLTDTWRTLKPWYRKGYVYVTMRGYGAKQHRPVHQLVLEAFVGPMPDGFYGGLHGPGGSMDNRLENLSWGTAEQNNGPDRLRDQTDNRNERHPMAKLTDAQVAEMRELRAQGWLLKDLSARYGVWNTQVSRICNGHTRKVA